MVLSLALILWFSGVARAEDKIGYVDLSRIFDEYSKTKEYDVVLEQEHNKYQEERNQRLNKLRDAQAKLALLKEEEKAKLQSEIDKDKADLLEFDRLKQTELRKQRDEKIREILLEIEKVVSDFAQKEKYKLILNDRVLVYGFPEWDLTEKVIKLLNQSYQKK
jgi:outer membrane protein